MKLKKLLAAVIAAAMCVSMAATAFAVGEDESTTEAVTNEQTTVENTTEQNPSEESSSQEETTAPEVPEEESSSNENVTEEPTSEENPTEEESSAEEETTEEPTEDDVIALIIKLLGQIDFGEVKDTLNDINEALGLPRVETFMDIPAYADAIYEKLEEMGLGYGDIINGLASSDLLDWLNNLIFGSGNSGSTTTTAPEDSSDLSDGENSDGSYDDGESTPDTGIALGAGLAAVSTMGISSALAFVLRKRSKDEE